VIRENLVGFFLIFCSFLIHFFILFLIRNLEKIDRIVISSISLIILCAIIVGLGLTMKTEKKRGKYMFKGEWFDNKGKMV